MLLFRCTSISDPSEPPHDKPTKWHVRQAKTQISLGIRPVLSESSLSAWRNLGSLATHWAQSKDWWDWADAQADLICRWAPRPFCLFCHAAAHYDQLTFIGCDCEHWQEIISPIRSLSFFYVHTSSIDEWQVTTISIFLNQYIPDLSRLDFSAILK